MSISGVMGRHTETYRFRSIASQLWATALTFYIHPALGSLFFTSKPLNQQSGNIFFTVVVGSEEKSWYCVVMQPEIHVPQQDSRCHLVQNIQTLLLPSQLRYNSLHLHLILVVSIVGTLYCMAEVLDLKQGNKKAGKWPTCIRKRPTTPEKKIMLK